ncbi:hypothetical protein K0J45_02285 [Shewanella alkalitolerans]|uniref:hypothetical protein n=1 Tax=Shewanella alkalitolerans TaxID=2864209 RepID=UPI001C655DE4|nr:hypothetical protein [Shewanella alkalitolerans]QYJ99743.1 hypothetical protein K0J45_02285 [Shewanella alkalitolerans]
MTAKLSGGSGLPTLTIQDLKEMLSMKEFFRENFKMLFWTAIFFVAILGGIYYVEAALEAQVQVVE